MGIKRLSQFLKSDFTKSNLSNFTNKRFAIDVSCWIYQAYFCQHDYTGDDTLLVIRNIELKLKILEKYNISAIFVFDGHDLKCKSFTSEKRAKKRKYYLKKASKESSSDEEDDYEKIGTYERYSQPIPESLFYSILDFLKYRNKKIMVAPYESDSQLAFLYHQKEVDYVVSEDSDMFVYDVRRIIKGIRFTGDCKVMDITNGSRGKEIQNLLKLDGLIIRKKA